jgi:hypothetical protein
VELVPLGIKNKRQKEGIFCNNEGRNYLLFVDILSASDKILCEILNYLFQEAGNFP